MEELLKRLRRHRTLWLLGLASVSIGLLRVIQRFRIRSPHHRIPILSHYDYIIVGAGAAGCTTAAELSSNPSVTVLVLEAGGQAGKIEINAPIGTGAIHNIPEKQELVDWKYRTADGKQWLCGKILGGSSSINSMIDFDVWAQKYGCKGWSFDELLPYFKRMETYEMAAPLRGNKGPISVRTTPFRDPIAPLIHQAALNAGMRSNEDYNGESIEGIAWTQMNINKAGRRHGAYQSYLESKPVLMPAAFSAHFIVKSEKLTLLSFVGKRAAGVSFIDCTGKSQTVFARREVIVASGAVGSPKLLLLSGVGPRSYLQSVGIPVVHDLPGVGENLQDHVCLLVSWPLKDNSLCASRNQIERDVLSLLQWLTLGTGRFLSNGIPLLGFVRTQDKFMQPDIQLHLGAIPLVGGPGDWTYDHDDFASHASHPYDEKGRGVVRLSSLNPIDPPYVQPNYLNDEQDMQSLVDGFKLCRKIASQAPLKAALKDELISKRISAKHAPDSDAYVREYIREYGRTLYHPVGTCRMGALGDPMAVVNPDLKVVGLQGLRVADASVMPELTSGNTNSPSILVGLKAGDLISEEWWRVTPRM